MPGLLKIIRNTKNQKDLAKNLLTEYKRLERVAEDRDIDFGYLLANELEDANKDDLDLLRKIKEKNPEVTSILTAMEDVLDGKLSEAFHALSENMVKVELELQREYDDRLLTIVKEMEPAKASAKQIRDAKDEEQLMSLAKPYLSVNQARQYLLEIKQGKKEDFILADPVPDDMKEVVAVLRKDDQLKNLIIERHELAGLRTHIDLERLTNQTLDEKFTSLKNYNDVLKHADTRISHPSTSWSKLIYDAVSVLSVLGAAVRALWSLGTTGSAKFWKTEGEKLAERSQKEQSKFVPPHRKS